jgi:hypothetical protein
MATSVAGWRMNHHDAVHSMVCYLKNVIPCALWPSLAEHCSAHCITSSDDITCLPFLAFFSKSQSSPSFNLYTSARHRRVAFHRAEIIRLGVDVLHVRSLVP